MWRADRPPLLGQSSIGPNTCRQAPTRSSFRAPSGISGEASKIDEEIAVEAIEAAGLVADTEGD